MRSASQDGTAGSVPHMIAWVIPTGWGGEPHRKEPTMSSLAHHKQRRHHDDSVFLGMGDALGRANVGDKALTVIQLWWALRDWTQTRLRPGNDCPSSSPNSESSRSGP